ncbi:MAG: hypothetical protein KDG50_05725 [Chromatiales bacterium]|nr:hypothetical protein [Chromatiales bacterium]
MLKLVLGGALTLPQTGAEVPRLPALERLLHGAVVRDGGGADTAAALLAAAGVDWPAGCRGPTAALYAVSVSDGGLPADAGPHWLCATPVHLRPDTDRLVLFPPESLVWNAAELAALRTRLATHLADDGLSLHDSPRAGTWLIGSARPIAITTHPLVSVAGRNIGPQLPGGPDAVAATRLMTEAQMLFHSDPVNTARLAARRPALNGLWLWGEGALPAGPPASAIRLVGDDPLLRGLAGRAAPAVQPSRVEVLRFDSRVEQALLSFDAQRWLDALAQLDAELPHWLDEHAGAARDGIELSAGDGRVFRCRAARGLARWRRPRPFADYLRTN